MKVLIKLCMHIYLAKNVYSGCVGGMFTVVVSVCNDHYTDEKKKKHTPHCNFLEELCLCVNKILHVLLWRKLVY